MATYEVDYFLPGAFSRIVKNVALADQESAQNIAQLIRNAPEDTFGFAIIKVDGARHVIKTYYINAELFDQHSVAQLYGRNSNVYRAMSRNNRRHMIRLCDGALVSFDPAKIELVTR